jgi:hypothetical protein
MRLRERPLREHDTAMINDIQRAMNPVDTPLARPSRPYSLKSYRFNLILEDEHCGDTPRRSTWLKGHLLAQRKCLS